MNWTELNAVCILLFEIKQLLNKIKTDLTLPRPGVIMLTLKLGLNMCELFSMFILINILYFGVKFNLEKIVESFWIFFSFSFEVLIFYPVEKSNCSFNPCPTWPHFIYFCRFCLCSRHLFVLFWVFFIYSFLFSFFVFMFLKCPLVIILFPLRFSLSVSFLSLSLFVYLFRLENQIGWDQFNTTAWWFGFDWN